MREDPGSDMAAAVIDLAGTWLLREAIGETWRWYARAATEARNNVSVDDHDDRWIEAPVPGSVIDTLWRAGVVPDPRHGFGSRAAEWTGSRHWVLARTVDLGPAWITDGVTLLVDGVDPGGRVLLDGVEVARLDGLYDTVRVRLPIEQAGSHTIVVVVDPVPPSVPQVGRTEDVRRHAPRLGAGWDFCPPLPHQGIWRGIRLVRGPAPLEVTTRAECSGDDTGVLLVQVRTDAADGTIAEVAVEGEACAPTSSATSVRDGQAELRLPVSDVQRWWPHGLGGQPMAQVSVRIGDVSLTRRTGFRTISWGRTPGSPVDALPYGLHVNARPVPLCGVNWAPADVQLGSITRERVQRLLDLAVAAGVRLVRVWGGGLVETEEFYEACDERGLLVWQEFSQTSSGIQSAPTDDHRYLDQLGRDARTLVPARAHHPSLVLWCGGNELEDDDGPLATERSAALRRLAGIVADLDPGRGWLPTSPSGGAFHHRLDEIDRDPWAQHDVHGPWEFQGLTAQHTLADAGTALAHTEFGVEGAANARQHARLVPATLAWPADRTSALYRHLGEWWNNAEQVSELFGGVTDLATMRRASQWLQTTGLAVATEADRRRWPRTSMVLPWQLAESYPNAWCTALVDHLGEPKPALAALARAFAAERVTLRTATSAWAGRDHARVQAWVWSLGGRPGGGRLSLSALDITGEVLEEVATELPPIEDPAAALELSVPVPTGMFLWRARWRSREGELVDDERIVHTGDADLRGLLALPRTRIVVEPHPDGWLVHNTGDIAAIGLAVHDNRSGSDERLLAALGDPRPLLPGERTTIRLVSGHARPGDLTIDAFNVAPTPLGAHP